METAKDLDMPYPDGQTEKDKTNLAPYSLLLMMPTAGSISTATVQTLLGLTQTLTHHKIPFAFKTFEWSDLVMSRNYLMSYFLMKSFFSHALLLDSDLSFDPTLVLDALRLGEDFVIAPYPQRKLNLDRLAAMLVAETTQIEKRPTSGILAKSLDYLVQKEWDTHGAVVSEQRSGFRTVAGGGTGFMLVARKVPETMVEKKHARNFPRQAPFGGVTSGKFFDFFSHLPDNVGSYLYAEDQSFCRRWVLGCKGKIWAHDSAKITHHGSFSFAGNYAEVNK